MNGVHDLGGSHGFGRVEREQNEPVFHEAWEGRICVINRICSVQGFYNIDEFRHGIERMAPAEYLAASYYERWLATVERNLVEKGILTAAEVEARTKELRTRPNASVPRRDDPALTERMVERLRAKPSFERPGSAPPRFKVGQRVVARNINPAGHTRLPRYARGKRGVISQIYGVHVFPDASAHGQGEQPQTLYNVRFEAGELWGEPSEPCECIHLDLWESYLDPA